MNRLKVRACAKLNLTLDVGQKRADGYHDMTMIMQSVDLCDEVTVELNDKGSITVTCGDLSGEDNLAYAAAKRYLAAAGVTQGVDIAIEKNITVCGGLAGGSADAAAVLTALDKMVGGVDADSLAEIALSLGADVPFAMTGGTAFVSGVGEKIQPISPLPKCWFVLAQAGQKDSTGKMFARLDAICDRPHPDTNEVLSALEKGDLIRAAKGFYNAFDPLWQGELPSAIRCEMMSSGAVSVALSGSGPTLFGTFAERERAEACLERLKGVTDCQICSPTDQGIIFE